jgi:hypothetical protein
MRSRVDAQRLSGGRLLQRAELVKARRAVSRATPSRLAGHGKAVSAAARVYFGETLGKFNQNAPIGRILDFSEGDDEPQPFDDIQVDLILAKQLQQFIPGVIGIVDVHRTRSGRP